MKKRSVVNLIKYYTEHNDSGFRKQAYEIAHDFDAAGDNQLSEYIMALLSEANAFVPQELDASMEYLSKVAPSSNSLPLPKKIVNDVKGIVNAVSHDAGVNKFLFAGLPGTGKTETAKRIAAILKRDLFIVSLELLIDSKLGNTAKNISSLFHDINNLPQPKGVAILFDEIDAIALDRVNKNDVREMGRATSTVLTGLDNLNDQVVLIATTNLDSMLDKALSRRFDFVIDFNCYTREDLIEVSEAIVSDCLKQFKFAGRDVRLFKKIISLMEFIPYPGDLKNLIRTSIAFSDPNDEFDYLRRLYRAIADSDVDDYRRLKAEGFTLREIEVLTGRSKSSIARDLKEM